MFRRRSFLKSSSLIAGGLVLPKLTFKSKKTNQKKLKIAVVGCGGRGTGAAVQALRADNNVELIALADAFKDRLEMSLNAIKDEFTGEKEINIKEKNKFVGFDAYEKAIDRSDVVILASPPGFRPSHFEYAINKNKHVFMEKPVATDAHGVRQVLNSAKIAKEKNLNVVVGLQRRYQKSYLGAKKQIDRGIIGKIISAHVRWNSAGVWVKEREMNQTEMEYQMRNWYYFNWLCGDHICEQHIHNLDVANWFLNEYPDTAQGMGGREIRKDKKFGEIFDHHYVEFKYKSGAIVSSQCRHQPNTHRQVNETIIGTKGVLEISGNGNAIIKSHHGDILFQYNQRGDESPYQIEHNKLFKNLRSGGYINDGENGAKATLTSIMGRMATYTGKIINWEDAMSADDNMIPKNLSWNSNPPTLPDSNGLYKIPRPGSS